jgi:hypothetical protein
MGARIRCTPPTRQWLVFLLSWEEKGAPYP